MHTVLPSGGLGDGKGLIFQTLCPPPTGDPHGLNCLPCVLWCGGQGRDLHLAVYALLFLHAETNIYHVTFLSPVSMEHLGRYSEILLFSFLPFIGKY